MNINFQIPKTWNSNHFNWRIHFTNEKTDIRWWVLAHEYYNLTLRNIWYIHNLEQKVNLFWGEDALLKELDGMNSFSQKSKSKKYCSPN